MRAPAHAHAFSPGAVRSTALGAHAFSHPPSARSGDQALAPARGRYGMLLRNAANCAIEEVRHVLLPRFDGLERFGEAVRNVVALRDMDGSNLIMRDAVLDDVDAAERPDGAANRAHVVAGEDLG